MKRSAAAVVISAISLAACTSSAHPVVRLTPATVFPTAPSSAGSPGPNSAPLSPAPLTGAAARFAARLQAGVRSVRSAHFTLTTVAAGVTLTGVGDETLSNAIPQLIHITESLPLGTFELIIIGPTTYARLPQRVYKTSKPWLRISASSSSTEVQQLAQTISTARTSASLDQIDAFAASASSITNLGAGTVDGQRVTRYAVTVSVDRLPADYPAKATLQTIGLKTIPVELDLDAQGRPVEVSESVSSGGQNVSTTIVLSRLNQPVSITAPPASEVGTR